MWLRWMVAILKSNIALIYINRISQYMCSKCGLGIIISEGIVDYALNVMLLVQLDGRRVVIVSSWGDV